MWHGTADVYDEIQEFWRDVSKAGHDPFSFVVSVQEEEPKIPMLVRRVVRVARGLIEREFDASDDLDWIGPALEDLHSGLFDA